MSAVIVEPWACETTHHERLLRLAGAGPQAAICSAGRGNVDLMIKLCRDGYDRVECLRQATCACADQGADILVIAGGTATESLVAVARRTAKVLRDGGVLALQPADVDEDRAVRAALAGLGLEVVSSVFDATGPLLVAHTVRRRRAQALAS